MHTLHLLFNAVTVIFIAATMFTAGLGATIAALRGILTNQRPAAAGAPRQYDGYPAARLGHRCRGVAAVRNIGPALAAIDPSPSATSPPS
jgi:hypothetical protein